jgi:hypothetical protein
MTEGEFKKHLEAAEKSPRQTAVAVSGLTDKTLRYKPAPDKWCILEILGHLADVEIVFGHRIRLKITDLEKSAFHPELNREWRLAEIVEKLDTHSAKHLEQIDALKRKAQQ